MRCIQSESELLQVRGQGRRPDYHRIESESGRIKSVGLHTYCLICVRHFLSQAANYAIVHADFYDFYRSTQCYSAVLAVETRLSSVCRAAAGTGIPMGMGWVWGLR